MREGSEVRVRELGPELLVLSAQKGWGHGAALCQFGAFGLTQAGRGHEEILAH